MALLTNKYSGLITKGLGLPACEGMLTMQFHLFHVKVEVIGGGGGGPWPSVPVTPMANQAQHPAYWMTWNKQNLVATKLVVVTVNMQGKQWKKQFVVEQQKAKLIVKAVNFVEKHVRTIKAYADKIGSATRRAIARVTFKGKK